MLAFYTKVEEIKSLRQIGVMLLVGFVVQFIIPTVVFFAVLQIPGVIYKGKVRFFGPNLFK